MIDLTESHAERHRPAAPIAGGIAAKVGVSESSGRSSLFNYAHSVFLQLILATFSENVVTCLLCKCVRDRPLLYNAYSVDASFLKMVLR